MSIFNRNSTEKYEKMVEQDFRKDQKSDQGAIFLGSLGIGAVLGALLTYVKKKSFERGLSSGFNTAEEIIKDSTK